jgi:acetyltransferase
MEVINSFFDAKSVAVVGVSEDPGKLGSIVFNNMLDAGYKGKLYPINPKHEELYWHKCYANVSDIPEHVDLVVIVVPTKFVKDVIDDCGKKAVKAVIIITAGFKEIGGEGAKLEEEIMGIAKRYDMRIIGPNCLGIIVPDKGINASFAASTPKSGNVAFLSQSGAFCTAILDMAVPSNLGFSHFVSFGNKVDIDEIDILNGLMEDVQVDVLGMYLEESKYGQDLMKVVNESKKRKPVIVLKAGQSDEAKQAIVSHTGAVAGSAETFDTAMKQSGIIEAKSLRDLYNLMMGFSWIKSPKGKRIGIVTNAGGPGIVTTDLIVKNGLQMAKISDISGEKLKAVLPATASIHNPIDIIGDALADRYQVAIQTLGEDENVDIIMVVITPQLITQIEETSKIIINAMKVYKKPIIPVLLGDKYITPALSRFMDNKFAAFRDIKDAVDVITQMVKFSEYKNNQDYSLLNSRGKGKHKEVVGKYVGTGNALPDEVAALMAEEVGILLPNQMAVKTLDEAVEFAKDIYPIVIKASNKLIAHKTDFKAIYVNLKDESDLRASFTVLEQTIKEKTGLSEIEILVQEMVIADEQLFIGANRDGEDDVYSNHSKGFGHLMLFGQGGIYTEVYHDFAYAIVPASKAYLEEMLDKTNIVKILNGARGKDALPKDKFIDQIMAVQKLLVLYPEIKSMDINPLLINKDKVVSVDIKIFM